MSTHTPGPWFTDGYYVWPTKDAGDGEYLPDRTICEMSHHNTEHDEIRGADARLVAAAPDMLEVLRLVAEHFADTDAPLGKAACAAINKALLPSTDGSK